MPTPITSNALFYGDNLPILREHITDAEMPPAHGMFREAPKVKEEGEQMELGM